MIEWKLIHCCALLVHSCNRTPLISFDRRCKPVTPVGSMGITKRWPSKHTSSLKSFMESWKIMEMKVHVQKSYLALWKHFEKAHYGQHLQEGCHKRNEVWLYGSPRCARPPEKKMREKANSVSFRQETTVNYLVQSCAASCSQTSSLKASMGLSAFFCNWQSLCVFLKWTRKISLDVLSPDFPSTKWKLGALQVA